MTVSCGFVIQNIDGKILIVHPTNDYSGEGIWVFPKGMMENDETYLETAYREVYEETNLNLLEIDGDITPFDISHSYYRTIHLYLFRSKVDLYQYQIYCNSLVENDNDSFYENDDFKFVTIDESLNFLSEREKKIIIKNYNNLSF